jgi:hypothetical protein
LPKGCKWKKAVDPIQKNRRKNPVNLNLRPEFFSNLGNPIKKVVNPNKKQKISKILKKTIRFFLEFSRFNDLDNFLNQLNEQLSIYVKKYHK